MSPRPALASLLLLALGLRLVHLDWSLPHVYEEATPLHIAWQMWGWDRNGTINLNPEFFNYPSLTMYVHFAAQGVLYLVMRVTGGIESASDWLVMYMTDPTPLFLTARFINVAFGVGTAWIVFRTAHLLGGTAAALAATALIAVNPFHIARSQMVEVDVPLTFFTALALHTAARISTRGWKRDYLLAGISTGLAASTKYTGILLLLPVCLAHLLIARSHRSTGKHDDLPLRNLVFAVTLALATFAVTSPFVIIDAHESIRDFRVEREHMDVGHFGGAEQPAVLFYAGALARELVGIPTLIAALIGIGYFAVRGKKRDAVVFTSFIAVYLTVISTWTMKTERYLLPILPPILILAGAGLATAIRGLKKRLPAARYRAATAVLLVLVFGVNLRQYVGQTQSYQRDTRTDAADWIEHHVPAGSYLVLEPYGPNVIGPPILMTLDPGLRKQVIDRIGREHLFAVQTIPMFQTAPERSAHFYSLDLYPNADYFVTSSGVGSRYRRDPVLFAPQIAFYDELEHRFEKVQEFAPARAGGLRLAVYRRPSLETPFAFRGAVAVPARLGEATVNMGESEAKYYYEVGANYEFFRRFIEATGSYRFALERGTDDKQLFYNCVLGETRCLLALGRTEEAVVFLRGLSSNIDDASLRGTLTQIANELSESMRRRQPP
jgi:4-amino-4-deoxy-L-arabinose transferase-like glycosyltransferase